MCLLLDAFGVHLLQTWNQHLANMAYEWSTQCYFLHGQPHRDHVTLPYVQIGQTMMASSRMFDPILLIEQWHKERPYYNYHTGTCYHAQCGNYVQVSQVLLC